MQPEMGTHKGKQEIKVSPVSLQEGLWFIACFHSGTPNLSMKQVNLIFAHSVYLYIFIYICAYVNICTYMYVA